RKPRLCYAFCVKTQHTPTCAAFCLPTNSGAQVFLYAWVCAAARCRRTDGGRNYMVEKQKPGKVLMLPVDAIEPSPWQARTAFDDTEIAALAVSILQNGLLQPISVRSVGVRKYQLIAGERRLRACRLAKLETVPAILADWTDSESAALGLLENIQRSQLDPFDSARGIREVIRLWGCTQAEAARRLGLSQPALANKLRLLTLTPAQQQLCTAHDL